MPMLILPLGLPHEAVVALEAVATERARQVADLEFNAAHDNDHTRGELAMAAACYATPARLYQLVVYAEGHSFVDPWPWHSSFDKRPFNGNMLRDNSTVEPAERRRQLVKAAALILAELERLERAAPPISYGPLTRDAPGGEA